MPVSHVSSVRAQTSAHKLAVDVVMQHVKKVQSRMTEELRLEDPILGMTVHGSEVHVAVDDKYGIKPDMLRAFIKDLLAKSGAKSARVELSVIRKAIEPVPRGVIVDRAFAAIQLVQKRLTTDLRAEDDIVGMRLDGNDVKVALHPHTHFSDANIEAAVQKHLAEAGLRNAHVVFIRPAIDPIFIHPPAAPAIPGTTMKDRVGIFATHIQTVQHRMTEEIRIEDAVKSVKLKGAKVEITVRDGMATSVDAVKAWAKEELKKRNITLPVTFKIA